MTQYGVRILTKEFETMSWVEFKALLAGLSADTPLGRVVSVRAEDDANVLKHFTKEQHRIRNEWRSRNAKNVSENELHEALEMFKSAFLKMAGV